MVGGADGSGARGLGGSELLAARGGTDRFPALPADPAGVVEAIADVATHEGTLSTHDVSHGGLAVTLAEMVGDAGADVTLVPEPSALSAALSETPGRVVVETTEPEAVRGRFDGVAPVKRLGEATDTGRLALTVGDVDLAYTAGELAARRSTIADALD